MDKKLRLAELRAQINAAGFNCRPTTRLLLELSVHVTLLFLGIVFYLLSDSLLAKLASLILSTAGAVGVGSNTHTSSHNATSHRLWLNRALTYFGFTFLLGLSTTYWARKHLAIHHQFPNVYHVDSDIDLEPWLALTADDIGAASPFMRTYYRYQILALPFLVAFIVFNMQISGLRFLLASLRSPNADRMRFTIDALALSAHYVVWLLIPSLVLPVSEVVLLYAARCVLLSYAMFAVLAPAHFPQQAPILSGEHVEQDRTLAQIVTAIDFKLGWVGSFLCSGLNYQIEHHLFPAISPTHYPALSAIVRRFCADLGYPYHSIPWTEALADTLRAINEPQRVSRNMLTGEGNAERFDGSAIPNE